MFLLGCNECKGNHTYGPLIGRGLLALVFIIAGINKLMNFNDSVFYLQDLGFLHAQFLVSVAIVVEIIGGFMLLFGWFTRLAALALVLFLLIVSFAVHHFWTMSIDESVHFQDFFQNMAIVGGLAIVMCSGPGSVSLDALRQCPSHTRKKTTTRKAPRRRATTKTTATRRRRKK